MTSCVVSSLLVLFTYFNAIHTDPTISTSTPTPCYGDVVTLVCHHPEVASNRGKYLITTPAWRENGVGITPSTGIYLQDDTSEDHTRTFLTINITVDHFRNKSFNYSCFLVLTMPMGELETSGVVTVDPVDSPKKPHNVTLVPGVTSISGSLEHDKSCFEDHTFEFNVTRQEVGTTNEFWSVVNGTNFTIPGLKPGTKYNICTSAVSTSDKQVKSEKECQISYLKNEDNTTASPGPGGNNPTSIAVAAGVPPKVVMDLSVVASVIAGVLLVAPTVDVVGLMDVATVVTVGLLVVRVLIALVCLLSIWQLFRRRQHEIKIKIPTSVSQEQNDSSELVNDQGCCRAIRDQPRTASQRTTTNYPELDFNADIEVDSSILTVPLYKGEDLTTSKLVASLPPGDDQGGSSGVADNDSESEDLLASPVEETSPLPDNYIKVGLQGEDLPTPVQATTLPSANQYCTITLHGHGTKGAKDYSEKKDLMVIVHETGPLLTDDQHVKHVFPKVANDDSESEDHQISVHETGPLLTDDQHVKHVFPKVANDDSESEDHQISVQETSPPDNDWDQICISGIANDYKKPLNDQFRITQCDSITANAQCVPSDIGGVLFSPFECPLHDEEEEICHKREEMSTSINETQPPLPSTAASVTNLECLEEPLSTTTSVASGEGPDFYECPDVLKADDSNINHELDSLSYEHTDVNNVQTSANSKIPEVVSDCVCMSSGCQICCAKESRSSKKELISSKLATEEGKNSIQSIEFPPAKQTSTHNEKIYSYFGRPETGQNPLQWQQNLRMLPVNKTESLQCTSKRTDAFYNDRGQSHCMFVPWLAYLYEAVLHRVGAFLVRWQIVGMNIAPY